MIQCFANQNVYYCLHKTVNMVVFFFKLLKIQTSKGRALIQLYRVVSKKRGNYQQYTTTEINF